MSDTEEKEKELIKYMVLSNQGTLETMADECIKDGEDYVFYAKGVLVLAVRAPLFIRRI